MCHVWLFQQKATKRCFPVFSAHPFSDVCRLLFILDLCRCSITNSALKNKNKGCWEVSIFSQYLCFLSSCFFLMNYLNWCTIMHFSVSTKSHPFTGFIFIVVINKYYVSILDVSLDLKRILSKFEYSPNHFVHLNKIKRSERKVFTIVFSFFFFH